MYSRCVAVVSLTACGQKGTDSTPTNENVNVEVVTETIETDSNDTLSEAEKTENVGTSEPLNDIRFLGGARERLAGQ